MRANTRGEHLQRATLQASQRALRTFFGWADRDGYTIDGPILSLEKTRLPVQEADVYHIAPPQPGSVTRMGLDALRHASGDEAHLLG